MKTYNQAELKVVLELHLKLLKGEKGGRKADLSVAHLYGADLSRAYLSGANLSRADLSGADLSRAYLSGANLSRADLSGANLFGANLSGANLSGANLSRADLSGADLSMTLVIGFYLGQHFGYYFNGVVKIGCYSLSTKEWVKQYKKIGNENGYTADQIKLYGAQLKMLAKQFPEKKRVKKNESSK